MKKNTIKVLLLGLAAGISACTTGSRQNMAQTCTGNSKQM